MPTAANVTCTYFDEFGHLCRHGQTVVEVAHGDFDEVREIILERRRTRHLPGFIVGTPVAGTYHILVEVESPAECGGTCLIPRDAPV